MRYMVIETFRNDSVDAAFKRFREKGRMLPEGLVYLDSWLTADRTTCFQLMETDDPALFEKWIKAWDDLVEFDITPLALKSPRR